MRQAASTARTLRVVGSMTEVRARCCLLHKPPLKYVQAMKLVPGRGRLGPPPALRVVMSMIVVTKVTRVVGSTMEVRARCCLQYKPH